MEIAIAVFIGLWLSAASILAYRRLKKDYSKDEARENRK